MKDDTISLNDLDDDSRAILQGLQEINAQERIKEAQEAAAEAPASKEPEFREEELLYIFDSLMTQGRYVEQVAVNKRMKVVWRSRTVGEANSITRLVDTAGFNTMLAIQNHTTLMQMAHSLVAFNGRDFSEASLSEKKDFLEKLPEVLVIQLSRTLNKFDYKITKATEVGQENF